MNKYTGTTAIFLLNSLSSTWSCSWCIWFTSPMSSLPWFSSSTCVLPSLSYSTPPPFPLSADDFILDFIEEIETFRGESSQVHNLLFDMCSHSPCFPYHLNLSLYLFIKLFYPLCDPQISSIHITFVVASC